MYGLVFFLFLSKESKGLNEGRKGLCCSYPDSSLFFFFFSICQLD